MDSEHGEIRQASVAIFIVVVACVFFGMETLVMFMGHKAAEYHPATLVATGWVKSITASPQDGSTTVELTSAGPNWSPIAFHGGISTPTVKDYVITNKITYLPGRGVDVALNLNCPQHAESSDVPDVCTLNSWNLHKELPANLPVP